MNQDLETLIMDKIMKDIELGIYKPKDKLISENILAEKYRVPRITIRRVYDKLLEMGYIYSIQGKGRYVKERQKSLELVINGNESFSEKMKNKGYDIISQNILCEKVLYNSTIYEELEINKESEVYKIVRTRKIKDTIIAIHSSYVSKGLFKDIEKEGKNITSMFKYYKEKGYREFNSSKSILSVTFPDKEEREIFECPSLIPLIVLESNCVDKFTNKVLEYTKIIYRSDCFKYIIKESQGI